MSRIVELPDTDWIPALTPEETARRTLALEEGHVLFFPKLAFEMPDAERGLMRTELADPKRKNISYESANGQLRGVVGSESEFEATRAMLGRYHDQATTLVEGMFPGYRGVLRHAPTSLRLFRVEGRQTSWRKDDSRLHVDAFPSRPNYGERILRVFANISPKGEPRVWRVGESFEDVATRLLPRIRAMRPGEAALLRALRVTKRRRSRYDHIMLGLHDAMKHDADYQSSCQQETINFPAGSVWVCFSDQVSHAAMAGQYMMEQTYFLDASQMVHPELSPLAVLERMTGKALVGG